MGDDFDVVGRLVVQDDGSVVIEKVNSSLDNMKIKSGEVGGAFSALGSVANFVWGGLIVKGVEMASRAIEDFVKGIYDAGVAGQAVQAQLQIVLQSTGNVAGVTADQVNALAESFARTTKFGDDTVVGAENLLLTFTKIGKDVFPVATQTVLDMSQALGEDTKSAAIQLGKALQDPINGITALRRVGVNFSDDQKKVIEQMVKTGDLAGAQAAILKELQTEFGGSAEAAGTTFAGQLAILNNEMDMVKESIFNLVASSPLVANFFSSVNGFFDKFFAWQDAIKLGADAWVSFGLIWGVNMGTMQNLKSIFQDVITLFDDFSTGNVNKAFTDISKTAGDLWTTLTNVFKGIDWGGIGSSVMGGLGKIDFQSAFDGMMKGTSGLGDSFVALMKKIDWKKAGDALTTGINSVDWNKVGQDVKGLVDLGIKLSGQVEQGIGIGLKKINWAGLAGAIGHGFAQLVAGMVGGDWDKSIAGWQRFIDGAINSFRQSWNKGIAGWQQFLTGALSNFTKSWSVGIAGWQNLIRGAVDTFVKSWHDGVTEWQTFFGGAIGTIGNLLNGMLMTALQTVQSYLTGPISSAFMGVHDIIEEVIRAVQHLIKVLANIVLPKDLKPGSPTPFETGLRGIHSAMNDLSTYALPNLSASFALAPISPAGGSSTTNYIGGANNSQRSQHIGPVTNVYVGRKPDAVETLKTLRKPG
jgi:hypothetical protein